MLLDKIFETFNYILFSHYTRILRYRQNPLSTNSDTKKGVRIVSGLISYPGLGVPTSADKTDSPTPVAYTEAFSGYGIAIDAGAIVTLPSLKFQTAKFGYGR